jgi:hypothetical protein
MSDSCVRERCRKFRDGRTDVHDEGCQGRHSIVTDELVQKFDQCVRGKRRFTISELSEKFPETSRTTLYRIVTDRLGYHKFCARWVPNQQSTTGCITWAAPFFDEGLQKIVSRYDKCLMWMVTMWRSNAVMYVIVPYNKGLFSVLYFLTSHSEVNFGIAHVIMRIYFSFIVILTLKCCNEL